uniref:Metalloendopeptidase n=1 Tax=Parastrongyloides trichosuri TaxID=131310 RepID=A0A0N4Z326_PARTI
MRGRVKRSGFLKSVPNRGMTIRYCMEPFSILQYDMDKAIKMLQEGTCLRFVYSIDCQTAPNDVVRIARNRTSFYSRYPDKYNMIPPKITIEQSIAKRSGCIARKILQYLGLILTELRPDRDMYLKIEYPNISEDFKAEYIPYKGDEVDIEGIPFDFGSLLSRGMYYGSLNAKQALSSRSYRNYIFMLGQSVKLSHYDYKLINSRFCDTKCTETSSTCMNGGFPDPARYCRVCRCPTGYEGTNCEKVKTSSPQCGVTQFQATSEYQFILYKLQSGAASCYYEISVHPLKRIYLRVVHAVAGTTLPCSETVALQIKYQVDKGVTGLCLCGLTPDFRLISESEKVLIIWMSPGSPNRFLIRYKQVGAYDKIEDIQDNYHVDDTNDFKGNVAESEEDDI